MHLLQIADMNCGGQRFMTHTMQGRVGNAAIKADRETRRVSVIFSRFAPVSWIGAPTIQFGTF